MTLVLRPVKSLWSIIVPIVLLCFSVTPVLSQAHIFFEETVTISAHDYWVHKSFTGEEGQPLTIEMEVRSGDAINLYVMDEDNYKVWESDGSVGETYLTKEQIRSIQTTIPLGPPGNYRTVFDNTDSGTEAVIDIKLGWGEPGEEPVPGFTGIPALLGLLAILLVLKKRKA